MAQRLIPLHQRIEDSISNHVTGVMQSQAQIGRLHNRLIGLGSVRSNHVVAALIRPI
jgi:hypothetical protein